MIAKFTFGKVNHAALVYDKEKLFETDGDYWKAIFTNPDKEYGDRQLYIIRPSYIAGKTAKMKELCGKYENSPYSYWDLATNAVFSFLTRPIRSKVVGFFGSKKFMLCSELVSRIIYETTGYKEWKNYEGITPEDIRDIALENPADHTIKFYDPKKEG